MTWLRSRRLAQVLVVVVALGLVASLGYGFVTNLGPEQPAQDPAQAPADAPAMGPLGQPPNNVSYTDLGQQCTQAECYRTVAVESEEFDAEEAIDAIFTTLIDRGFSVILPPGEESLDDVSWEQTSLTDDQVIISAGLDPASEGSVAHLVIVHADPAAT